jgi:hypothetical protein
MALPTETTLFFLNFSSLVDSSTPIFLERVIDFFLVIKKLESKFLEQKTLYSQLILIENTSKT